MCRMSNSGEMSGQIKSNFFIQIQIKISEYFQICAKHSVVSVCCHTSDLNNEKLPP